MKATMPYKTIFQKQFEYNFKILFSHKKPIIMTKTRTKRRKKEGKIQRKSTKQDTKTNI
ncbi:MAG: hypothetical protein QXS66_05705 [Thermoproteota archaeon]|nr:hypothetical protein [Candidatus Brockarchaeota archaeon]